MDAGGRAALASLLCKVGGVGGARVKRRDARERALGGSGVVRA